jgi:hypothetical protein
MSPIQIYFRVPIECFPLRKVKAPQVQCVLTCTTPTVLQKLFFANCRVLSKLFCGSYWANICDATNRGVHVTYKVHHAIAFTDNKMLQSLWYNKVAHCCPLYRRSIAWLFPCYQFVTASDAVDVATRSTASPSHTRAGHSNSQENSPPVEDRIAWICTRRR